MYLQAARDQSRPEVWLLSLAVHFHESSFASEAEKEVLLNRKSAASPSASSECRCG